MKKKRLKVRERNIGARGRAIEGVAVDGNRGQQKCRIRCGYLAEVHE